MAVKKTEGVKEGYVEIELFKDGGKYKDDVHVILNGKAYVIQRGVRVQVPEAVAEIIEQSMQQKRETTSYIEQLENDYNNQVRRFG